MIDSDATLETSLYRDFYSRSVASQGSAVLELYELQNLFDVLWETLTYNQEFLDLGYYASTISTVHSSVGFNWKPPRNF